MAEAVPALTADDAPDRAIEPVHVHFDEADRRQVLEWIDDRLRQGRISQGEGVEAFERAFAEYTGAAHAVAVSSGTAALEIAMRVALDGRGTVVVPANGFFATAMAPIRAGASVALADVDPGTFAPGLDDLDAAYTPDVRGVIVIHMGGIVSPALTEIRQWCDRRGVWLFEDCAHAHGSRSPEGRHAGTYGFAGAFSFFATKVMTSGEGGMLITNDADLAGAYRLHRNLGKPDLWQSRHLVLGTNARMGELHALVGLVQLRRLDEFIAARAAVAAAYTRAIAGVPGVAPVLPIARSSGYKYPVLLPHGTDRDAVKRALRARGVHLAGEIYERPLHDQPVFAGISGGRQFPNAEDVCRRHVCLPIHTAMTAVDAERVVAALASVLEGCRR